MDTYLVEMPNGQYGIMKGTTVWLLDWQYSLFELKIMFNIKLYNYDKKAKRVQSHTGHD